MSTHAATTWPLNRNTPLSFLFEVLSKAADGVFAVDQNHRIILWNEAAERLLGYQAKETLGRLCYEVFAGKDRGGQLLCSQSCSVLLMAKTGESVQSYDILTSTKEGQPIWINVSVIVVPSHLADLFSLVHVFRDVTHQVQTEKLLQRIHSLLIKAPWPLEDESERLLEAPPSLRTLTSRELDVLRLIAQGESAKGIAEKLHISPATARNHTQKILAKLGVHTKLEALAVAFQHNLL